MKRKGETLTGGGYWWVEQLNTRVTCESVKPLNMSAQHTECTCRAGAADGVKDRSNKEFVQCFVSSVDSKNTVSDNSGFLGGGEMYQIKRLVFKHT